MSPEYLLTQKTIIIEKSIYTVISLIRLICKNTDMRRVQTNTKPGKFQLYHTALHKCFKCKI